MATNFGQALVADGIRRIEQLGGGMQSILLESGLLHTVTVRDKSGAEGFIPVGYADRRGACVIAVGQAGIRMRLRSGRGLLTIDPTGLTLPRGREPMPWSDRTARALAEAIAGDPVLQKSLGVLHRDMVSATSQVVAVTGTTPYGTSEKRNDLAGAVLSNTARYADVLAPSRLECHPERLVTVVEEAVYGWVEHTLLTSAEQAAKCAAGCLTKPWYEVAGCLVGCAAQAFVDIVTQTWDMIGTVTHEVIQEFVVCELVPTRLPSPAGNVELRPMTELEPGHVVGAGSIYVSGMTPQDVQPKTVLDALAPFRPLLDCMLGAAWSIERLESLGVHDVLGEVPLGIQICLDRACTDKLKAASMAALLGDLGKVVLGLASAGASASSIAAALASDAAVVAVATTLGVSAALVAAALLTMEIELAYQSAAVVGQITMLDLFGGAPNGVCLHYPFVAVAAGSLVLGPALGLNFPIIVTRR